MPEQVPYHERELLQRIAKGDARAFEWLYNTYRDKIYHIAFRLSSSREVAEDMVQEIFLKIWLKRETLNDITHFKAYLFTLARHHIVRYLNEWARAVMAAQSSGEKEQVVAPGVDNMFLEKEYNQVFQQAVSRLPLQQAQVYRLSKQDGLKREEIARQLHISPETVKAHLAQAMKNIRAYCLARLDLWLLIWFLKR